MDVYQSETFLSVDDYLHIQLLTYSELETEGRREVTSSLGSVDLGSIPHSEINPEGDERVPFEKRKN